MYTTPSISEYVISGISSGLINTAFGAAGREVTNSAGRVIATKLTNTIATNVVSSACGSLTTWLCSKKLQRAIEYLRLCI